MRDIYIYLPFFHIYLTSYDEKDLQNVEENHETLDVKKNQDLCFNKIESSSNIVTNISLTLSIMHDI